MSDDVADYKHKRNFDKTGEPDACGRSMSRDQGQQGPLFVIQKHDASSLHYDLRLEIDETLKSWAVPKGPSTDPSDQRLAIPTEDHPLSYADFEGVIPAGEYGAGTVLIWDRGHINNINVDANGEPLSLHKAWARGKLEFFVHGNKINGGYALIRSDKGSMKGNWLLTKIRDEHADARRNPVSTETTSVVTGRSLKQIKGDEGREQ